MTKGFGLETVNGEEVTRKMRVSLIRFLGRFLSCPSLG